MQMMKYTVSYSQFMCRNIDVFTKLCIVFPIDMYRLPNIILRFIVVLLLVVASLWIPNSFFDGYASIFVWASIFVLTLMSMLMIDLGYVWNDVWIGRANDIIHRLIWAMCGMTCGSVGEILILE
jgi:hypothetical protein